MKKVSVNLLMLLLIIGSAMAQQTEKGKAVYKYIGQDVPLAVLEEIEKGHPDLQQQREALNAGEDVKKQPAQYQSRQELDKTYLAFSHKKAGNEIRSRKTAEYNRKGNLISSRETARDKKLPYHVLMIMGQEYNGWALKGSRTIIIEKNGLSGTFYVLKLTNGKAKKRLLLNEEGQIVKNKKLEPRNTLIVSGQ